MGFDLRPTFGLEIAYRESFVERMQDAHKRVGLESDADAPRLHGRGVETVDGMQEIDLLYAVFADASR